MEDRGEERKKSRYHDAVDFLDSTLKTTQSEKKNNKDKNKSVKNPNSSDNWFDFTRADNKDGVYYFKESKNNKDASGKSKQKKKKLKIKIKTPSKDVKCSFIFISLILYAIFVHKD